MTSAANTFSNAFKQVVSETKQFFYNTPTETIAFGVAGVALRIFGECLSTPFLVATAASMVTRIIVKLFDKISLPPLESLKREASALNSKYPQLKTILLVSAIVGFLFFHMAGIFLGVALGIYSGLTARDEKYKIFPHTSPLQSGGKL